MATPLTRSEWLDECAKLAKTYEEAMTDEAKALVERLRSQKDYKVVGFTPVTTVNPLCAEAADRIERLEAALLMIAIPRVGGGQWASEIARKVMGIGDDA